MSELFTSANQPMSARELLLARHSSAKLTAPAPTKSELNFILQAAMRVPDHGHLQPWRFIIAENEGLASLGQAFRQAAEVAEKPAELIERAANLPYRAPLVITVIASVTENHKVPVIEQQIAAGCTVMAMQQAAFSLGIGGIWRTGDLAYDPTVAQALGLASHEQIVGFLYLGQEAGPSQPKTRLMPRVCTSYL